MRFIIFFGFSLFIVTANANEPINTCTDPDVNQQWQKALENYPKDRMLVKLSSMRTGLCRMLENNEIDASTARLMWEQALTTALLERAREEQARRGLLKLFGTF